MKADRRRSALLTGAVVVTVVGASCGGRSPEPPGAEARRPPAVGDSAPEFMLKAADGSEKTLQDVTAGRPALFYFSMGPG